MNFNRFLMNSDYSSDKEVVGLAIYFLDRIEEKNQIDKKDLRELISNSRAKISKDLISSYLYRLREKEGFVDYSNQEIKLTIEGLREYRKKVNLDDIGLKKHSEKFIELENVSGHFFEELIKKINICYQAEVYEAVLILSRKMIENLLISILRNEFGPNEIELYFNSDRKQFRNFSTLINNFNNKMNSLLHYSGAVDQNLIDELDNIREESNASAHSIEIDVSKKNLEDFREKANRIAKILFDLKNKTEKSNWLS